MGNFEIDFLLEKNEEFWKDLEIHCLVECCGIDAFALDEENILKIITNYNELDIKNNLEELVKEINKSTHKNISSGLFNQCENKEVFKKRIEQVLEHLNY